MPPKARQTWLDITPVARRDFIQWITSPKRLETRVKRLAVACDMLAKGKRRPCCFDRSGIYAGGLECPVADDEPTRPREIESRANACSRSGRWTTASRVELAAEDRSVVTRPGRSRAGLSDDDA